MARQPRKPREPRAPRSLIDEELAIGRPAVSAEAYVKRASITDISPENVAKLLEENARLREELNEEKVLRSEAEAAALAAAEAQGMLMQREIQEVPTGKFVTVRRLDRYEVKGYKDDGREIVRPIFKPVKMPTYFYKIDLPPSGGADLKINGQPLYHGGVYEFDIDTLRTVKEICFRCWKHDADIHGDRGENFYRKEKQPVLSMRAYR